MSLQDRFEELHRRNEAAELGGGVERIERQHKTGKKTARERLELLLDKGSFAEVDRLVVHQSQDFGMEAQRIPGDGVVTGSGRIHGRPLFVFARCVASHPSHHCADDTCGVVPRGARRVATAINPWASIAR